MIEYNIFVFGVLPIAKLNVKMPRFKLLVQPIVQNRLKLLLCSNISCLLCRGSFTPFWTIGCTYDINFGISTLNLAMESTPKTINLHSTIISMGNSSDFAFLVVP